MSLLDQMLQAVKANLGRSYDKTATACTEIAEKEAIAFLEHIREYERESGNSICDDERTSKELFDIYKSRC